MHSGMHDALEALGDLYEFGDERGLAEVARYLYAQADGEDGHIADGLNDAAITVEAECEYKIDDPWLVGDDADPPDVPYELDQFDVGGLDDIYGQGVAAGHATAVELIRAYHDRHVGDRDADDERPDYCDGLVEAQRRVIEHFGVDDPDPEWSAANAAS